VRHYQNKYLSLIGNRSDAVTLQRHFHDHDGIQQIWLPQLGVVDRCTACHTGLKEATLADVSAQPFRKHPAIPHTLDSSVASCVIADKVRQLLLRKPTAARWRGSSPSCRRATSSLRGGQCHRAPLTGTPQLNLGRNLLSRYGCVHCHTIKLPDGTAMKPTDDPPSLEHVADKTRASGFTPG